MTDTTDLIRRAEGYAGYKWNGLRSELHALTGLVEDKVEWRAIRMFSPDDIHGPLWECQVEDGEYVATVQANDPLIARLGALMQLVEKIEEGT